VSQHGRHSGATDAPRPSAKPAAAAPVARRERKLGPVSMETLLVLALVCVIAGASVIVNRVDPGRQRTQTITGQTTTKVQTLGQNGIQPGDIQPRTIVPVHSAASDELSGVTPAPTPKAPKPVKATPAPTTGTAVGTSTGTGSTGTGSTGSTGGTGGTGGTTNPGGGSTGGNCGLTGLLGSCPKGSAAQ
jgi:hypothetical protein